MQDTVKSDLNISDPVETLYASNLISRKTLKYLQVYVDWSWNNEENPVIAVADIVYTPKMCLAHIGNKSISEIIAINDHSIRGRIMPTKRDIKRVISKAEVFNTIHDDRYDITIMYFLTDMSVDDICKCLHLSIADIHACIDYVLQRVAQAAYENEWGLLDLITLSSMIDLYTARCGYYEDNGYYLMYIAGRIRDLLSSNGRG